MKLNDDQIEIATELRKMFKNKPEATQAERGGKATSYEHFIDFTRAMAKMLDGGSNLDHPAEMQYTFNQAWNAYANFWGVENRRVVLNVFGGDKEFFEHVASHPNGSKVIHRILERVRDTAPNETVDVSDILLEEMDIEVINDDDG